MTDWAILDQAHEALRTAVHGVAAGTWGNPTPCEQWNVTQVLQHAAGDQMAYAANITGGPGPSQNPFDPSGDLAGADPDDVADEATRAAAEAWATVDAEAEEVTVPIPPNTMPATLGVAACAMDAAVHAWDIAVATGQVRTSRLGGGPISRARSRHFGSVRTGSWMSSSLRRTKTL